MLDENQDGLAVNGHEPSVSSAKIPVKVENAKQWKARLRLSAAAIPVPGLAEFEKFGPKSLSAFSSPSLAQSRSHQY